MKQTITWLLIASFLLTFLASCSTRQSEGSKDDTTSTSEHTENIPSHDISNQEKYKPVLDIYKDVIINLNEKIHSQDSPYSEEAKEYEWE